MPKSLYATYANKFIVVLIIFLCDVKGGEGCLTKCHNDVKCDQNLFVNVP